MEWFLDPQLNIIGIFQAYGYFIFSPKEFKAAYKNIHSKFFVFYFKAVSHMQEVFRFIFK